MLKQILFKKPSQVAVDLGYALSQQGKDALDKSFIGAEGTNSQGYVECNAKTARLIEAWYSKQGVY